MDENALCYLGGFPGDGLNELFGVTVEELDTYYPNDKNFVTFSNGKQGTVKDYAERIRVQDANGKLVIDTKNVVIIKENLLI